MRFRNGILVAALAAGGCGPLVDDASNAPRLGRWEHDSRMLTLIANDVWIDRKQAPLPLPPDGTEVKECFEPRLKSSDEINESMMRRGSKLCRLGPLEWKGSSFASTGTCGPADESGYTVSGTIELTGRSTAENATARVSLVLLQKSRSGNTDRVRAAFETRWKRLGDCGRS